MEQKISERPGAARIFLRPSSPARLRQRVGFFNADCRTAPAAISSSWRKYLQQFIVAASKRPEIGRVTTTFNPATPQVKVELDREKARTVGVPIDTVFSTLQTYLSGLYVNDFVRFGRVYKVFLAGRAAAYEPRRSDIGQFYVRNNYTKWCH